MGDLQMTALQMMQMVEKESMGFYILFVSLADH